jgi:2-desacetyl-2-hydroxyethyl bacteriochlorophyllide A dehydrogenase
MKAVIFQDVGRVSLETIPDPELASQDDVIVRITCCAICGSDLHLLHGDIPMLPGESCGHEFCGVIEEVGVGVQKFAVGDRVVGTFHTACGSCRACARGEFHLCSSSGVFGYGPVFGSLNGTQAEFACVPVADVNLRRIPENVTDEQAVFCGDVLTTAYGGVRNAAVEHGETVAVIGCGPVGLMAISSAFAFGAARVIAIDLLESRCKLAESMGAIAVVSSLENPTRRIMELTNGEGVDAVIEAVGGPKTLLLAFELVRAGGRISAVGISNFETFDYPLREALTKDVTFRTGLANIHRDIDKTLELVAHGKIDPTVAISHRLSLEDAVEGYRLFDAREANKVVMIPGLVSSLASGLAMGVV